MRFPLICAASYRLTHILTAIVAFSTATFGNIDQANADHGQESAMATLVRHDLVRHYKDLPNFAVVDRNIYRGAAPTSAGLAKLKAMGVRTIIDLRIEKHGQAEEERAAQSLGLNRVRIPLGKEAPTKKQAAQFLLILKNANGDPVFVHCQYGADRTGAMIGIYRVTQQGWTFDRAYAEMRKFGFKPHLEELKAAVRDRAAAR